MRHVSALQFRCHYPVDDMRCFLNNEAEGNSIDVDLAEIL